MELILVSRAIYPLHGIGGMERHCHDWILAMNQAGCRIHVVTLPPEDARKLAAFPREIAFYLIPGFPARTVLRRITTYPRWVDRVRVFLNSLLSQKQFTAIYAHGLAAAAYSKNAVPLYYNPHGMEEFKCSGLKYAAYTWFRKKSRNAAATARQLIATDSSLIPEIVRFFAVPETKVRPIPNAVFLNDPGPLKNRNDLGIQSDETVLLSVGRLEPNKGLDFLLKALSIAKTLPSYRLIIAGDGSQRRALVELSGICRIEQRVTFTGTVCDLDLRSLYSAADLFVHPTLYEGSSLVTLEAMQAGLPVVASKTGGIPDKIIPGLNGWLVEPGNPRALANTLEEAFGKRERWKQMGMESARIVREKYSWPSAAQQFLKLFAGR